MIGHYLGAARGLEAIATMKAIKTGWLHPTINQFVSLIYTGLFTGEFFEHIFLIN